MKLIVIIVIVGQGQEDVLKGALAHNVILHLGRLQGIEHMRELQAIDSALNKVQYEAPTRPPYIDARTQSIDRELKA